LRSPGRFTAATERLRELYLSHNGGPEDLLAGRVLDVWLDAEAYRLAVWQTATRITSGARVGAESSLHKLFWSELDIRIHDLAVELLGAQALVCDPNDPVSADWIEGSTTALAGTIWGGTSEIQRNIVAHRLLGLPRS
jgi:alkylation response protein AidB-like acyl-CoA dehydrogenase